MTAPRLSVSALAAACFLAAFAAHSARAQASPPQMQAQSQAPARGPFEMRVEEVAHDVASDSRLKSMSKEERHALVEFVVGNMLFIVAHELGHGIIAEMDLAVLGREEDAADAFAIITGLNIGSDFSQHVLIESTKGWYLSAERDKAEGQKPLYYDEHGLNNQRAYQIVCFMVGSDPKKFKELADDTKMPKSRQDSCKGDYDVTLYSWDKALKPYLRASDQPKQKIDIAYEPAKGNLAIYEKSFRKLQFLEAIAGYAADKYAWPRPIGLVMQSCDGNQDARWTSSKQKIIICYDIIADFADLYRGYGGKLKKRTAAAPAKKRH